MKQINKLDIFYNNKIVGRLAMTKDRLCAFEYDAEWLRDGFSYIPFQTAIRKACFCRDP